MAPERLQESAEAIVPRATSRITPEGLTTREGLNLAGRTRPSVVLFPGRRSRLAEHWAAITVAEKEWLLYPLGLPGTAGRGPACPMAWEAGGEIPPPTRLDHVLTLSLLAVYLHRNRFGCLITSCASFLRTLMT